MTLEVSGIALAIVTHAWIGRIQGPPVVVNGVAWGMTLSLTWLILFGGRLVHG